MATSSFNKTFVFNSEVEKKILDAPEKKDFRVKTSPSVEVRLKEGLEALKRFYSLSEKR